MNKQEFIESLAEQCEFSKAEAGRVLDAILDSLTEVMTDREEVSFSGFGKFYSQRRKARTGVNPQDPSQKLRISAAHVPKFRPGATLRQAVSDGDAGESPAAPSSDGQRDGGAASADAGTPGEWTSLGGRG